MVSETLPRSPLTSTTAANEWSLQPRPKGVMAARAIAQRAPDPSRGPWTALEATSALTDYPVTIQLSEKLVRRSVPVGGSDNRPRPFGGARRPLACSGAGRRRSPRSSWTNAGVAIGASDAAARRRSSLDPRFTS